MFGGAITLRRPSKTDNHHRLGFVLYLRLYSEVTRGGGDCEDAMDREVLWTAQVCKRDGFRGLDRQCRRTLLDCGMGWGVSGVGVGDGDGDGVGGVFLLLVKLEGC